MKQAFNYSIGQTVKFLCEEKIKTGIVDSYGPSFSFLVIRSDDKLYFVPMRSIR